MCDVEILKRTLEKMCLHEWYEERKKERWKRTAVKDTLRIENNFAESPKGVVRIARISKVFLSFLRSYWMVIVHMF